MHLSSRRNTNQDVTRESPRRIEFPTFKTRISFRTGGNRDKKLEECVVKSKEKEEEKKKLKYLQKGIYLQGVFSRVGQKQEGQG